MTDRDPGQLDQRIRELEELNRLAQSLSRTLDIEETLAAIISRSLSLCRADRGAIVLFEPGTAQEVHTIARNADASADAIDHKLNMLVAGSIQHTQKPFITTDILEAFQYTNPPDQLRRHGASLAVPLTSEGKVIGMIHHVNTRGGEQFSPDAIRVAEIVANMASQFIVRARVHESLRNDLQNLKVSVAREHSSNAILGKSDVIKKVLKDIALVAPTSANVLIIGETGTGKELTARAIHYQSPRMSKPFIAVNCAAIPAELFESELFGHERGAFTGASGTLRGKFELADGGTLFLDEISEMPLALQPKLLRVLEEKKFGRIGSPVEISVDVRVIAASSKDLEKAMELGEFREALYHRLNVVPVVLPPLRERKEDIPTLAEAMIAEFSGGYMRFQPDALEFLTLREWKGNVRELRNTIERISIFVPAREISANDIREIGIQTGPGEQPHIHALLRSLLAISDKSENLPERLERELITYALKECSGNVSQAARLIGIERMALQRRIDKFGL